MRSDSIFDQRVYAQDTAPADDREGNIWVDTSGSSPATKVADSTGTWNPVGSPTITSPSDVSGSRTFGTQYTNSTDSVLVVNVSANWDGSDGDSAQITGYVDGTQVDGFTWNLAATTANADAAVRMMVPPGGTYQVFTGGIASTMAFWNEQELK